MGARAIPFLLESGLGSARAEPLVPGPACWTWSAVERAAPAPGTVAARADTYRRRPRPPPEPGTADGSRRPRRAAPLASGGLAGRGASLGDSSARARTLAAAGRGARGASGRAFPLRGHLAPRAGRGRTLSGPPDGYPV